MHKHLTQWQVWLEKFCNNQQQVSGESGPCNDFSHKSREFCDNPDKFGFNLNCSSLNLLQCPGNKTQQCIQAEKLCNGVFDCTDRWAGQAYSGNFYIFPKNKLHSQFNVKSKLCSLVTFWKLVKIWFQPPLTDSVMDLQIQNRSKFLIQRVKNSESFFCQLRSDGINIISTIRKNLGFL